jgi:hypothetical protein
MSEGGPAKKSNSKVKVAYKDIDGKTYENIPNTGPDSGTKGNLDVYAQMHAKSYNKDGSFNISHTPSASDSTYLDKKYLSPSMRKKYLVKKNECGGKAKKHYFGGWL